jgi:PAS domain S-box-containing protein
MERLLARVSIGWMVAATALMSVAIVIAIGAMVFVSAEELRSAGEIARTGRDNEAIAATVRIALGDAIRHTATFLRTHDEGLIPTVRASFQAADAAVAKLAAITRSGDAWADDVATLAAGVGSMNALFDQLVSLESQAGFGPDQGLRAGMFHAQAKLHRLIDGWVAAGLPVVQAGSLQERLLAMQLAGEEYQLHGEDSALEDLRSASVALQDAVGEKDVDVRDLAAYRRALIDYSDAFESLIGTIDQARGKIDNLEAWATAMTPRYDEMGQIFGAYARAGDDRFTRILTRNVGALIWAVLAAVALGCAGAILFGRALARPITRMTAAMNEIAAGDLAVAIPCQEQSNELGEMARALAVFKENAAAIRRANEEMRTAQSVANLGSWIWDPRTDELLYSEEMLRIFGLPPDRPRLSVAQMLAQYHPDDRPAAERVWKELREGKNSGRFQARIVRPGGAIRWVEAGGEATRDSEGRILRMFGTVLDITDRRQVEDELRQLQKTEALGQLTGGIAHDFNNQLAVISGNLELLLVRLADRPDLRSFAEKALRSVERGTTLTRSLLAFARKQPLSPEVVDANQLVGDMEDLIRRTIGETIELATVRSGGLWKCEVDSGQLENALLNLVINARDAMPRGGKLTIELANARLDDDYAAAQSDLTPGQYVMLAVSDSGVGMTPDLVARAFDPFFTTKEFGKGSGLGLSMVQGFVKQSGGHAKIYSEPGTGTTVKLYLPRSLRTADAGPIAPPAEETLGGSERILVVEDDPDMRTLVFALLASLGYEVLVTGTAAAALDILAHEPTIDLLLTDVVLGKDMNGRELADKAVAAMPGLKVLYMSGYTENAVLHHGRLDVGIHLLQKPFKRADLAAKVRFVLDQRNA